MFPISAGNVAELASSMSALATSSPKAPAGEERSRAWLVRLPAELQVMILKNLLAAEDPISNAGLVDHSGRVSPANPCGNKDIHPEILRTCKQFTGIGEEILYKKNRFHYNITDVPQDGRMDVRGSCPTQAKHLELCFIWRDRGREAAADRIFPLLARGFLPHFPEIQTLSIHLCLKNEAYHIRPQANYAKKPARQEASLVAYETAMTRLVPNVFKLSPPNLKSLTITGLPIHVASVAMIKTLCRLVAPGGIVEIGCGINGRAVAPKFRLGSSGEVILSYPEWQKLRASIEGIVGLELGDANGYVVKVTPFANRG